MKNDPEIVDREREMLEYVRRHADVIGRVVEYAMKIAQSQEARTLQKCEGEVEMFTVWMCATAAIAAVFTCVAVAERGWEWYDHLFAHVMAAVCTFASPILVVGRCLAMRRLEKAQMEMARR